jgi:hypothetical protein
MWTPQLQPNDGRASLESKCQEQCGGWDCHVFGSFESPAQSPRHDAIQGEVGVENW